MSRPPIRQPSYHAHVAEDLGTLYHRAREQVEELVRSLGPEQLETPIPSCPGWTVHGVVSHLAGVATDAINGRLRGVPGPEQTAAQVEERSSTPTSIVLREWERTGSQLEVLLRKSGGKWVEPVVDVVVHEQDIRGALGLPGNRQDPLVDLATAKPMDRFMSRVDSAGLPPVKVVQNENEPPLVGDDTAPVTLRASRFELFRALYGRRSRKQLERRFTGTEEPDSYVRLLCIFGPAAQDIIE